MQDKTAPQLSVCGAAECCRMTIFTGGFSMENIRIYEEDGYIHFIMRPEDLMRLRYSTEAKTPFADFMDRWLTQMKTQVRENTRNNACHGTADGFSGFCQPEIRSGAFTDFDRQVLFHHAQVPEIRGSTADYPDESVG